jgi:outer membrane scaffolding protein for murein synthesis (MipA/OmpV family)
MRTTSRLLALVIVLSTTPAVAEEPGEAPEHHHHENHVAVFVGATTGFGDMVTTRFTIGADYERRLTFLTHMLGAGALVDVAIGNETETLVAGFLAFHPVTGLMILGGVGAAITSSNTALGLRGSVAYYFTLGRISLGPQVSVDYANKETAIVYGASAGLGF